MDDQSTGRSSSPLQFDTTKLRPYYEVGIPISLPKRMYPYLYKILTIQDLFCLPWPKIQPEEARFLHILTITYTYLSKKNPNKTGFITFTSVAYNSRKNSKCLQHKYTIKYLETHIFSYNQL